ncbi:hypothetical protein [Aerococcus urinae]
MHFNRKQWLSLGLGIIALCLIVLNWSTIVSWLGQVWSIAYPITLGAMMAYVVNILMSLYEKYLWPHADKDALDSAENVRIGSDYDLLLYSQHTAPTGEPSYFLNQFFRTNGSDNRFDYSNPEVDRELDQLGQAADSEKRDEIAKSIQEKIINDRPIIRLVDPEWHAGIGADLGDYQLYCGDYYIVNPSLGVNK